MIQYATDENYYDLVKEGFVLVDFFTKTCGPCKMQARVLDELDDEFPFINIVKVDVEECVKVSEDFKIQGVPNLYYYKDGIIRARELGAVGDDVIREKLTNMLYE